MGALTLTWDKVKKGTSAFPSSFLTVLPLKLTGKQPEKAAIQGEQAHSQGVDTYQVIRGNQARQEGTDTDAGAKRKYYPLDEYVPC